MAGIALFTQRIGKNYFQGMSITLPKPLIPLIKKPMTPPWVVAIAIATQLAISHVSGNSKPICTLDVQRPHHSTHVAERSNIDVIKLNVISKCTAVQTSTNIDADIFVFRNGVPVNVYSARDLSALAVPSNPKEAHFQDLFVECRQGNNEKYLGIASGSVILADGKRVQVSGTSGNYHAQYCGNKAK